MLPWHESVARRRRDQNSPVGRASRSRSSREFVAQEDNDVGPVVEAKGKKSGNEFLAPRDTNRLGKDVARKINVMWSEEVLASVRCQQTAQDRSVARASGLQPSARQKAPKQTPEFDLELEQG